MTDPRLFVHDGVARLILRHTQGSPCGPAFCRGRDTQSEFDDVPLYLALLAGIYRNATGAHDRLERNSESVPFVLSCFKLRRCCSLIAQTAKKSTSLLNLDALYTHLKNIKGELECDVRNVLAAIPVGFKIIGLSAVSPQKDNDSLETMFQHHVAIARIVGTSVTNALADDNYTHFNDEQPHFKFGVCGTHYESGGPRLVGFDLRRAAKSECVPQINVEIQDLKSVLRSEKLFLVRSRLPLQGHLSPVASVKCLESVPRIQCSCHESSCRGVLLPILPPETTEEVVQQLQVQEALLSTERGIFFRLASGTWIFPGRSTGDASVSLGQTVEGGEPSMGGIMQAHRCAEFDDSTKENSGLKAEFDCLECFGSTYSPSSLNDIGYRGNGHQWMSILQENAVVWAPCLIPTYKLAAAAVTDAVVCVEDADEPEGIWGASATIRRPSEFRTPIHVNTNNVGDSVLKCGWRIILDVLVLVEAHDAEETVAMRLLNSFVQQIRFVASALALMGEMLEQGTVTEPFSPPCRLAAQDVLMHLMLECGSNDPVLSLTMNCFSPPCFASPIVGMCTSLPVLRRGWIDFCCSQRLEPIFSSRTVLPRDVRTTFSRIANPHRKIQSGPKWMTNPRCAHVEGNYEYYHYLQDGINDGGWGCCYRSLQTVLSWYRHQGYTTKAVPTHWEMQELLKLYDPAHAKLEIGTREWIGTVEGHYLISWYLGIQTRIIYLKCVFDITNHVEELMEHFNTAGTPILMGVGNYAYSMVGVAECRNSGQVAFLIVDPHYTGEDNVQVILDKGWVGWKKMEFLEKMAAGKFINLALPQTVKEDGTYIT